MLNIAVLVSGGGTNLQALLDSEARGENPNGRITLVVASKPGVYALERAAKAGVEGCVVRRKDYATSEEFDTALLSVLKDHGIELATTRVTLPLGFSPRRSLSRMACRLVPPPDTKTAIFSIIRLPFLPLQYGQ